MRDSNKIKGSTPHTFNHPQTAPKCGPSHEIIELARDHLRHDLLGKSSSTATEDEAMIDEMFIKMVGVQNPLPPLLFTMTYHPIQQPIT